MAKVSSQQRVQIGSTSYVISSKPTNPSTSVYTIPKQQHPFSIHLSRNGQVEITFDKGVKPIANVSRTSASGHSANRHEDQAHSSSTRYPKPPRSDVATIGSSTYLHAPSIQVPHYTHAGGNSGHSDRYLHSPQQYERKPSPTPRHAITKSPQDSSRRLLDVSNDRQQQQYKSSPRVEKRASIPVLSTHAPTNSPQKHAHFALPQSMPNQSNLTTRVPASNHHNASPSQHPSRYSHHHTHSHESYFRHRPQGWFNRRGDQFIQRGVIKRQPRHLEWDIIFAKYPEPGTGWMDAEGHFLPPAGGILKHSPG